jgi:hypothetical protein
MSVYSFEKLPPHEPTRSKEILSVYLQGLLDVDIHIIAGGSINGSSSNSFLFSFLVRIIFTARIR